MISILPKHRAVVEPWSMDQYEQKRRELRQEYYATVIQARRRNMQVQFICGVMAPSSWTISAVVQFRHPSTVSASTWVVAVLAMIAWPVFYRVWRKAVRDFRQAQADAVADEIEDRYPWE